jgi:diaminohydroxyphosphoribosylaminopyrimidine deaminase/5-amino-6-(5-phosphoribosylamino)uracil reductase
MSVDFLNADSFSPEDIHWMQAALEWSRRGRGWTLPRPSVGCVLVRDNRIIGGGHTQPGNGQPHAEVTALRAAQAAGESTRGATAYVTLEPCCHWATTPPCTDALIEAGIARVVSGVEDPNPAVAGRGYEMLREAGIEVVVGVLADECFRAHDDFLKSIVTQTPFVTLKIATSLDGKIALPDGESKWITGEAARARAHRLRHEHGAVLVGVDTVLTDDPQLDVRLPGEWRQPVKIILDSRGRTPLNARVLSQAAHVPVYIATTEAMSAACQHEYEEIGVTVLRIAANDARVDIKVLLLQLYQRGVSSLLVEGGAHVAGAMLQAGLVDKVVWFVAPKLIGAGREALGRFDLPNLAAAPRLNKVLWEQIGDDMMVSGYL